MSISRGSEIYEKYRRESKKSRGWLHSTLAYFIKYNNKELNKILEEWYKEIL